MADYVYASSTSSSGTPILSLLEAHRHLNLSTTEDDEWVTAAIKTATRHVEGYTGRAYLPQRRRLTMHSFADTRYVRNRRIYPERTPLSSSTAVSITYVDSQGTTQTLPSSDYLVHANDNPCYLSEAYNATWPNTRGVDNDVTITYSVNTSTPSVTVKHALGMLLAHWYNQRESHGEKTFQEVPLGVNALLAPDMIERYG